MPSASSRLLLTRLDRLQHSTFAHRNEEHAAANPPCGFPGARIRTELNDEALGDLWVVSWFLSCKPREPGLGAHWGSIHSLDLLQAGFASIPCTNVCTDVIQSSLEIQAWPHMAPRARPRSPQPLPFGMLSFPHRPRNLVHLKSLRRFTRQRRGFSWPQSQRSVAGVLLGRRRQRPPTHKGLRDWSEEDRVVDRWCVRPSGFGVQS